MSDEPTSARAQNAAGGAVPAGGGVGMGLRGGRQHRPGMGPSSLVGSGEKAKNFKQSLKRLLGRLREEYLKISIVIFLAILAVAGTISGPKLLVRVTNEIVNGTVSAKLPKGVTQQQYIAGLEAKGQSQLARMLSGMKLHPGSGVNFAYVGKVVLIVGAIYVLGSLFLWLQNFLMAGIIQRVIYRFRRDVDLKLARLPLRYFDSHPRGDILSRVTNDTDNIQQTLNQTFSQIINAVFTLLGVLGLMFSLSWLLAIVSLIMVPLSASVTMLIAKRSQKQFALQWANTGTLNGHVEEMFTGHNIVKVFGRQKQAISVFDEHNAGLYQASFKAQFISGIIMPSMMFIGNLTYVALCIVGGLRVAAGALTIGPLQAMITYNRQFTQPITQVASVANVLQSAVASSERVFELLDETEESADPVHPFVLKQPQGHIQLEDVSFRYLPDKPLIEDLNLDVQPGQTVAIVGPTGAGKTTLVNLLMRFYEVDQGRILIDGEDTQLMARDDLRRLFGMVLQDAWLFGGSIRDNIAYGKDGATWEQIKQAADAAHVDHFVRTLSAGYDTRLDDDSTNLSQGERQLLTIARAFLADPEILILDEATSSVDTRTEVLIQRAMARLLKGRTSFVIAHRLSTIRDADVILVMNEGQIIEQGTHEELLARGGFYYDLYSSQFSEALVEAS